MGTAECRLEERGKSAMMEKVVVEGHLMVVEWIVGQKYLVVELLPTESTGEESMEKASRVKGAALGLLQLIFRF